MPILHRAAGRGRTRTSWLDSRHSFSFADWHDPDRMGLRALRVLNDDRIAGGAGFPTHGHRDMEIISWVVSGALAHRDSTGGEGVIRPGEVQRMRAGRGISHSEFNAVADSESRFLQIWLLPDATGLAPGYLQKPVALVTGTPALVAGPPGAGAVVDVRSPARLWALRLDGAASLPAAAAGEHLWLQVVGGTLRAGAQALAEGDALQFAPAEAVPQLVSTGPAEVLAFHLA